jgi:hypothetical protein
MTPTVNQLKNDESGYVMVAVLLMLVLLTVIGVAATNTSQVEMQISGNTRRIAEDLYTSEAVLVDHLENFRDWLTDDFLTAGETVANFVDSVDLNADGDIDGTIEIRCVEDSTTPIAGLSTAANDLPDQAHIGPPPPNTGESATKFEVRRYGLTSSSTNQGGVVQIGVWKMFNKF